MPAKRKYALAVVLTWALALIPSAHYAYRQLQENRIVDHYLNSRGLASLPVSKASAIRVSDQIRSDFNVKRSSFVALKMGDRPFLREDTRFLLTHKEGECGEGTRVIINLLSRLGFDATRITLYDRTLNPAHTLVSVVIDGSEYFVDSINSSVEWNGLLKTYDVSTLHFNVLPYEGNIITRTDSSKKAASLGTPESLAGFLNHYWLYSYEAIPYSKLLSKARMSVRAFNLERPHRLVSLLAEKPNLLMFFFTFALSLLITYILHRLKFISAICARK